MAVTLITGATGFIGSQLARHLADQGEPVKALCRATADTAPLAHDYIRLVRGDIRDPAAVERAMGGCDRVFHLAGYARNWAKDPVTFLEINVNGFRNVLEAARKLSIRKVVFTSTALTLGPSARDPVQESTGRTVKCFTDYEYSKLLAEELTQRYVHDGVAITIVNPTRVFGPGLLTEGNSVTRMIQWYIEGKWRFLAGRGEQIGNYAFVEDVVRGHVLAMERGRPGERYTLGGENVSLKDFFARVSEISGRQHRLFRVPFPIAFTAAAIERIRAQHSAHYPLITPE